MICTSRKRKCFVCEKIFNSTNGKYCSNECRLVGHTDRHSSECWIWKGSCLRPYGICVMDLKEKTLKLLSRLTYEMFKGKIPDNLVVFHSCKNHSCCNPDHLFVGNRPYGEQQKSARLTNYQVIEIKKRLDKKENPTKDVELISKEYGVCRSVIAHIRCGRFWKKVKESD